MDSNGNLDLQAAHRKFSADCFNHAWDLIEKESRSPEEEEEMLHLCLTSLWHWTQRADCTSKNLSVAYWQAARVFTLLKNIDMALRYAQRCFEISQENKLAPFYLGFACEALARAYSLTRNQHEAERYLRLAEQYAGQVSDPEDRETLEKDLLSIRI